jgi:predicted acetyltransferase
VDTEIRSITEDEYPAWAHQIDAAFGGQITDERLEAYRPSTFDRTLAAFEAGDIVATAGAFSLDLTLPGLTTTPAAGVTAVGVRPTHRGQGLLRRLMAHQLDDVAARGEAVAILLASESRLYGRFGYGWATSQAVVSIDTDRSQFARPVNADGRMRLVDLDTARKVLPPVHERIRRLQPGDVSRTEEMWRKTLADLRDERGGYSAMFVVVHEAPGGEVDGYARYRFKDDWPHGLPRKQLRVQDLLGLTAEVEAALWRYLLDMALVDRVEVWFRPLPDPIRRRLVDPRQLRYEAVADHIWVRLVDVPAALSARRYGADGEVIFEVVDDFRPATSGRYRLEASGQCERVGSSTAADLALDIESLGAAYLGGVRFSTLAAAGLVTELTPAALARADAMFTSTPDPFCRSHF